MIRTPAPNLTRRSLALGLAAAPLAGGLFAATPAAADSIDRSA